MGFIDRLLRGDSSEHFEAFPKWFGGGGVALVDPSTLVPSAGILLDRAALSLPSFYRGTQILQDLAGQLPWQAVRGGIGSDQRAWAQPEVLENQPKILVDPSPFHTRGDVIREGVRSLILRGNAYFWITGHDANGFATMAVPVNPDEVYCRWNDSGTRKIYEWRGQLMTEGFDFLHIMFPALYGEPTGLSPLEAGSQVINYTIQQQKFAGSFYGESAVPSGVIEHPGRLNSDEAEAFRAQWESQHAQGRGTAILSGGMKYQPISLTPEQAQFLQSRAFSNQEIAKLLGIPAWFLNAGSPPGTASALTYQNLSAVFTELTRLTLAPTYLTRLEEGFGRLLPRGQAVRFDTSDLLRTDDATRWAAQKVALDAGILTNDEVRAIEGLAPLPDTEEAPEPTFTNDDERENEDEASSIQAEG